MLVNKETVKKVAPKVQKLQNWSISRFEIIQLQKVKETRTVMIVDRERTDHIAVSIIEGNIGRNKLVHTAKFEWLCINKYGQYFDIVHITDDVKSIDDQLYKLILKQLMNEGDFSCYALHQYGFISDDVYRILVRNQFRSLGCDDQLLCNLTDQELSQIDKFKTIGCANDLNLFRQKALDLLGGLELPSLPILPTGSDIIDVKKVQEETVQEETVQEETVQEETVKPYSVEATVKKQSDSLTIDDCVILFDLDSDLKWSRLKIAQFIASKLSLKRPVGKIDKKNFDKLVSQYCDTLV